MVGLRVWGSGLRAFGLRFIGPHRVEGSGWNLRFRVFGIGGGWPLGSKSFRVNGPGSNSRVGSLGVARVEQHCGLRLCEEIDASVHEDAWLHTDPQPLRTSKLTQGYPCNPQYIETLNLKRLLKP